MHCTDIFWDGSESTKAYVLKKPNVCFLINLFWSWYKSKNLVFLWFKEVICSWWIFFSSNIALEGLLEIASSVYSHYLKLFFSPDLKDARLFTSGCTLRSLDSAKSPARKINLPLIPCSGLRAKFYVVSLKLLVNGTILLLTKAFPTN